MKNIDLQRRTFITSLAALALTPRWLLSMPRDVVDEFRDTYLSLTSFSADFSSDLGSGSVKAKKGGKYLLSLHKRQFVCDGKAVYTLSTDTKTMLIDTYNPQSDQISIDRILFVLLNVYVPTVASTNGIKSVIRLTPPDASATIAGVKKLECTVNKKMIISSIKVFEGGSQQMWTLKNVVLNPTLADATFTVKPKRGWSVVDLR